MNDPMQSNKLFAIFGILIVSAFLLLIGYCTGFELIVFALAVGAGLLFLGKLLGPIAAALIEFLVALAGLALIVGLLVIFGFSPLILFLGFVLICIWTNR